VATAAAMIDCSQSFIWKLLSQGKLTSVNVGKRRLVMMSSIDALLGISYPS
jgi:excisionase family DNA binding protein